MRKIFSLFTTNRRSVIAEEMVIRGDLISRERGPLEIHGRVEGKVVHDGPVIVEATGYCARDIQATSVEIAGEVRGNVEASQRLIIRSSGHLFGNAHCQTLVVQSGATFEGTNRPLYTALPAPPAAAVLEAELRPIERPVQRPVERPAEPTVERPAEAPRWHTETPPQPAVDDEDGGSAPLFQGGITFKG